MPDPATARLSEFELTPGEFGPRGDAIARDPEGHPGGDIISVPGAIPGERVRVTTLARRRGIVHTRVVDLLEASPDRVLPPCPEVARGCGACQWQHVSLPAQRDAKRAIVAGALGLSEGAERTLVRPTVALAATGYRTTVHAAVTAGRAGFRRYRSHRVVPVEGCLVAHPLLVGLILEGEYGDASEVLLRCGARTGDRFALPSPKDTRIDLPGDVRRDHVTEIAAGRTWRISAGSFFQTRADGVDALAGAVTAAAAEIEPAGTALDLYSGVGLFAGVLAERGWTVIAVERDRAATDDARVNLRGLDVSRVRGDVTRWKAPRSDLVVADPGRAGLERRGVDVVNGAGAGRVILVSCDAASLGRDAALLRREGYALSSATPIDLFPHTFHTEVVSVFDR